MSALLGVDTNGLVAGAKGAEAKIFLRPGDWLVGGGPHLVDTLLGSCVSVVLWDAQRRLGAMCHCLLPQRPVHLAPGLQREPGHYVDEALRWMIGGLSARGSVTSSLTVMLAGGAGVREPSIGQANVEAALMGLQARGLVPKQRDTGGAVVRKLRFNLADGELLIVAGGHRAHHLHRRQPR